MNLRIFFDTIETCMRGLEALGMSPMSYGSLLLPVLLKKLPEVVKRSLFRDGVELDLEQLRDRLQKEVEIRELSAEGDIFEMNVKKGNKLPFNNLNSHTTILIGNGGRGAATLCILWQRACSSILQSSF